MSSSTHETENCSLGLDEELATQVVGNIVATAFSQVMAIAPSRIEELEALQSNTLKKTLALLFPKEKNTNETSSKKKAK